MHTFCHNLDSLKFTEFIAKFEPVSRFLIDPIAITWRINLGARKFTKFIAKYERVSRFSIDPLAITC